MGAEVVGVEDDLASVLSLQKGLRANALKAQALHSDVDEALTEEARFDIIVTNPPFTWGVRSFWMWPRRS